jgi:hypothetical protein
VQVKTKSREVQLHKDSALGEAVLECYASGNRNVFSLGFVPVAGDNTVVLLARDTPASSPAVRDLGVDMSQVSRFVPVWDWVVRAASRSLGLPAVIKSLAAHWSLLRWFICSSVLLSQRCMCADSRQLDCG